MKPHHFLALLALPVAAAAQDPTATPTATSFEEAVRHGKLSFNARARFESVEQTGLRDADALTVGARLGYTTAPLNGFHAMVEGDRVVSLGEDVDLNSYGLNLVGDSDGIIGATPGEMFYQS